MRILVTGATGLIGTSACARLASGGHVIVSLQRSESARHDRPTWNLVQRRVSLDPCGPLDAVLHLAGETIAQRWTAAARARIRESRVQGTRLLSEALASRAGTLRPRVLLAASGIGVYGDRGDELLDEGAAPGAGFLSEVVQAWEQATAPAVQAGIRVVQLRLGVVLSARGGALAKMLPVFRLGLGGRVGSGRQWMSWVTLEDAVRAIEFCLTHDELNGPVNIVAPAPITNAEFTSALARQLRRPAWCAVPAWGIRGLFGEMGSATLLASTRVVPSVLQRSRFTFDSGTLTEALRPL